MKHLLPTVALMMSSASVLATPTLFVDGSYSLNGGSTTPLPVVPTSTGQKISFTNQSTSAAIDVRTQADLGATASFSTAIGGTNHFSVSSLIAFNDVITNTTAIAQNYTFHFTIDQSSINFNVGSGVSATGSASRDIQLSIDGSVISHDRIDITIAGSKATCANESAGGTLGTYSSCSSPNADFSTTNAQSFAIALGSLLPGGSLALDFRYLTTISYAGNRAGGCSLIDAPFGAIAGNCGGASAFIGDPFDTESSGFALSVTAAPAGAPGTLPEPTTLSLVAGTGLLFAARRKRNAGTL